MLYESAASHPMFIWIQSSALGVALQELDKALRGETEEFMDDLVQAFATTMRYSR